MKIDVHVDADPSLPDIGHLYFHCTACLGEQQELFADITTPRDYARQQGAISADGHRIQIRCTRHNVNVVTFTLSAARFRKGESR